MPQAGCLAVGAALGHLPWSIHSLIVTSETSYSTLCTSNTHPSEDALLLPQINIPRTLNLI